MTEMIFRSVVFPLPLGPMMPTLSPFLIVIDTLSRAVNVSLFVPPSVSTSVGMPTRHMVDDIRFTHICELDSDVITGIHCFWDRACFKYAWM